MRRVSIRSNYHIGAFYCARGGCNLDSIPRRGRRGGDAEGGGVRLEIEAAVLDEFCEDVRDELVGPERGGGVGDYAFGLGDAEVLEGRRVGVVDLEEVG